MTPAGFPHSDIHGSTLASSSPWLFAGSRVLHRLLVPRHPPCALSTLTSRARFTALSRQAPYTRVVGLKSEVPFVTSHSHIHSAFASQLPPRAAPSCEISLLVVFCTLKLSEISGTSPENWRELEAEALVGLTYEILKREAPGFS
jgi:hypothetical protein